MHIERNKCPDWFQRRITEAGGRNRYGGPNFRLIWGQTETFRAGGTWAGEGQVTFKGYRDLLIGMGDPCWMLQQWEPPEKYGSLGVYLFTQTDEAGYLTLGEYPFKGRYETVMPLMHKEVVNGQLVINRLRLTSLIVDILIPVVREASTLSAARRKAMMIERKEAADREQTSRIEASLSNAYPEFKVRSSAYLQCNSVVQKKMEAIERHWKSGVNLIKQRGKGMSLGVPR